MASGVFEDYEGWHLPYRTQLIRVDTMSKAGPRLAQLAVSSQSEVGASANDEFIDSTQELGCEGLLEDMEEEEEPDGHPGDMAASNKAFNL